MLTSGAHKLAHLNGEKNLKIVEYRPPENILSIVVCIRINKSSEFKSLKFKNPYPMNLELGRHIVWNVELKKKKRKSDFPKEFTASF